MTLSKVCFVRPGQAVEKRPQPTGKGDHRAPRYRPAPPTRPAARGQPQRRGRAGRCRPAFPAFRGQRAPAAAAPSSTARARGQSALGSPPRGGGARRGPARGQGGTALGGGGRARGEPAWRASCSARRRGSERVPAGTGGGSESRSRIPGPAVTCGPAAPPRAAPPRQGGGGGG